MEALAARGHTCRAVARIARFGAAGARSNILRELAARGSCAGRVRARRSGLSSARAWKCTWSPTIPICAPTSRRRLPAFPPDVDPDLHRRSGATAAGSLLAGAVRATVYLARATLALPFGPDCAFPSEAKTGVLRQTAAVVGVSQYVADYIRQWSGIPAVHVPISLLDPPPYPDLGRFENEFVTLVNPCAVKGISIFLALADRMPDVRFRGRAHVGHQRRRTARRWPAVPISRCSIRWITSTRFCAARACCWSLRCGRRRARASWWRPCCAACR